MLNPTLGSHSVGGRLPPVCMYDMKKEAILQNALALTNCIKFTGSVK